jgi:hypothetical protein
LDIKKTGEQMKKTILILAALIVCGGCTITANTDNPPPPQPTLDPVAMADGLELQSADNPTGCKNIHRPTGSQIGQADLANLGVSSLLLDSAKIYVELRQSDQSVLSNVRGYVVSNGPTVFTATADCVSAGEDNLERIAAGLVPLQIDLAHGEIQSDLEFDFPILGAHFPNPGTAVPATKISTPQVPSLNQWFANQASWGKADLYLDSDAVEVMYSYRASPMSDGTSWFQFVIARYQISK